MRHWLCILVAGVAAQLAAACATTESDSPEQQKIEQEYDALQAERAEVEKQKKAAFAKCEKAFEKAAAAEKKAGVSAKDSTALVPDGAQAPAVFIIGPLQFDKKGAEFRCMVSGSGEIRSLDIKPQ
jgi:hypothetical protein